MCGLAGAMSSYLSVDEKANAKLLLWLAQLRGTDSTGIFTGWKKKQEPQVTRLSKVMKACDFLEDEDTKALIGQANTFLIAGHTRAATVGAVNEYNAQPIREGNIIACHNGHIGVHREQAVKEGCSDSRIFIREIATLGLDRAVHNAGLGAAFALTYIDLRKGTFNIIRNYQRPLGIMYSASEGTMYWASEIAMLEMLRIREGITKFEESFQIKIDTLFSWPLGGDLGDMSERKIEQPKASMACMFPLAQKKLEEDKAWEEHIARPSYHSNPSFPPWLDDPAENRKLFEQMEREKGQDVVPWVAPQVEVKGKVIPGVTGQLATRAPRYYDSRNGRPTALYKGYMGNIYSAAAIAEYIKQGCRMCLCSTVVNDPVYWLNKKEYVCRDCEASDIFQHYLATGCFKNPPSLGELYHGDQAGS